MPGTDPGRLKMVSKAGMVCRRKAQAVAKNIGRKQIRVMNAGRLACPVNLGGKPGRWPEANKWAAGRENDEKIGMHDFSGRFMDLVQVFDPSFS